MKKIVLTINLLLFALLVINAQEQTSATEAGEDFDLNAVMQVLENAEDLADFEKKINDKDNQINNLDLNNDEEIDVIKVVEIDESNTRVIVLRAVIGENDYQDIATIEIEKHSEKEISLQVIGDPDIYGSDYIVEPSSDESSGSGQGGGDFFQPLPTIPEYVSVAVFVSVHRWRPIGPLFVVGRVAFISAVGWRPVPVWFIVRRPIARSTWRGRSRRYKSSRYRSTRSRHSKGGKNMYSNKRKNSSVAKKNSKPKASSNKGPNTGPSNNQNKAKASPAKSTTPNQQKKKKTTTAPKKATSNKSKRSSGPPKKKKH
ncbi:MAG: hypothetical protein J7L04_09585 [Bacteroidales bacterium]|nr:hypothetical protein [Bacteroidales bacterium]